MAVMAVQAARPVVSGRSMLSAAVGHKTLPAFVRFHRLADLEHLAALRVPQHVKELGARLVAGLPAAIVLEVAERVFHRDIANPQLPRRPLPKLRRPAANTGQPAGDAPLFLKPRPRHWRDPVAAVS